MTLTRTVNQQEKIQQSGICQSPEVKIQHHKPDFENLFEEVFQWSYQLIQEKSPYCIYINPAVVVFCDQATPEFFETSRKHQSLWCKKFRKILGRRGLRKVSNWPTEPGENRLSRRDRKSMKYFRRNLCFTGLLFIEGKLINSQKWPDQNNSEL